MSDGLYWYEVVPKLYRKQYNGKNGEDVVSSLILLMKSDSWDANSDTGQLYSAVLVLKSHSYSMGPLLRSSAW